MAGGRGREGERERGRKAGGREGGREISHSTYSLYIKTNNTTVIVIPMIHMSQPAAEKR